MISVRVLLAGLLVLASGSALGCIRSFPHVSAEAMLKDSAYVGVFIGQVVRVSDKGANATVRVIEDFKGGHRGLVELTDVYRELLHGCSPHRPRAGEHVLVISQRGSMTELWPRDPDDAYIEQLRMARRLLQSNNTPHADARNVPPLAEAAGARAGGRER